MKPSMFLFAGLVVLSLTGCSAVYTTQPIGERPCRIEARDWDGTWIHKDGSINIKVTDGEKGLLRIAWIEPKEKDLVREVYDVELRESGGTMFAATKDDSATTQRYFWACIKRDGKQAVVWLPDAAKFKALVRAGKLPGTIEEDRDVILGNLEPGHLSLIAGEQEGVLFSWDEPIVFLRFAREGD